METLTHKASQNVGLSEVGRPISPAVWSWAAAALLAVFYFATSIYIASHRLFWYDEFFTVHIARLPRWVTIFKALAHGVDSQPPIYYMLVRMSDKLLGHSEVAARLPSTLAMAAGLLITFDCARRLTNGLHGLIALSFLTCSFLPYYGYEARPYALLFMLSALAFWIWACTRYDSKWGAFFLARCFVWLSPSTITRPCAWRRTQCGRWLAGDHGSVPRRS